MFEIQLNDVTTRVWTYDEFPYNVMADKYTSTCKSGRKEYNNVVTAFDIETTTIEGTDLPFDPFDGRTFGFMYVWMFAVDEWDVCVGRTWEEFVTFREILLDSIHGKIVTYSHNLAFEFQNMRNFLPYPEKVFARNVREPVYVDYGDQEFRCSYILTNMSLDKFLKNSRGVTVFKANGEDFDYRVLRYPDTPLNMREWDYAIRDVVGLVQGIKSQLKEYDDTLATIPYTSTGYVRRDYLEKCKEDKENQRRVKRTTLDRWTYGLAEEAKRGGVAGSNALYTDEILEGVFSRDKKSSYPYQMLTKYFPDGRFMYRDVRWGSEAFEKYINTMCCIMYVKFPEIRSHSVSPVPYISKSLCKFRGVSNEDPEYEPVVGNGKLYYGKDVYMAITEIDYKIIEMCYRFDKMEILKFMVAPRGMLSRAFRKHLADMFQTKTELETGDKYIYNKYKNKINASFGMMLTAIIHPEILYQVAEKDVWKEVDVKDEDIEYELKKHYRNIRTFLSYQDGVYVTAHGRWDLYEGIYIPKNDTVAVDTDSVKFIGEEHNAGFEKINKKIIEKAESFDIKPYAVVNGKKTYLGVWEEDAVYSTFRTLGAKKYAYTLAKEVDESGNAPLHVTVSGLNKESGARYLDSHGGIERFCDGMEIPARDENDNRASGRTASSYIDLVEPVKINVNGHDVVVGSNVGVLEVPYTIGVTGEWMRVMDGVKETDIGEVDEEPFK